MNSNDLKMDKNLGIDTVGHINWPRGVNLDYFRTESTAYNDLDILIKKYKFLKQPKMVDFGSGKGRIIYYLNYILDIPTTGIEVNSIAYLNLRDNYYRYKYKFPNKAQNIELLKIQAEQYNVKQNDNIFYFFNPFTVKIFKKVMENIEKSLKENPRIVDVILYYPGFDYTYFLEKHTKFHQVQKIKTKMYYVNSRECFKIFRYIPNK